MSDTQCVLYYSHTLQLSTHKHTHMRTHAHTHTHTQCFAFGDGLLTERSQHTQVYQPELYSYIDRHRRGDAKHMHLDMRPSSRCVTPQSWSHFFLFSPSFHCLWLWPWQRCIFRPCQRIDYGHLSRGSANACQSYAVSGHLFLIGCLL